MTNDVNRRDFLKATTVAAGAVTAASLGPSIGRVLGANERVVVGVIGCGGMGRANMRYQMGTQKVDIAAVCDVYEPHLQRALEMTDGKATTYKDFRKLLERKDIDAVIVATPDHWHALAATLACEAGKDVFVEKPLALTIGEGRRMVQVARRTNRVVQVGTMQRSGEHFQRAVEIVKSGVLGKISFVRTWNYGNEYPEGIGNPPDSDPPKELDWDMWLGPAPYRKYNPNRCIYEFRWFWDYAGGKITDWGTHLIDIAVWAMGEDSPKYVSASGGKYHLLDNRETPDTMEATFEFDNWILTYTNQDTNSHGLDGRGYGIQFYGTNGTFFVDREGYELFPEYEQVGKERRAKTMPVSSGGSKQNEPHAENFIECIKTRKRPICDVEIGHRSTLLPHLGNIALWTGQRLQWDGKNEKFVNNPEADKHLIRAYRSPWKLPEA